MNIKFTNLALDALDRGEKQQLRVWDEEITGLCVVVGAKGPKKAMFVVRAKRTDGNHHQENIGRRDQITLPEARKKAKELLGKVVNGQETPGDKRRLSTTGPTLLEAVERKLTKMEHDNARPSAMKSVRDELLRGRHLRDWHKRPLRDITPWDCRERHLKIANDKKNRGSTAERQTGKHTANRIMLNLGAVWNLIAEEAILLKVEWPVNPTHFVHYYRNEQVGFNRNFGRRKDPIPWSALPAWRAKVDGLKNPLHRLFYYLVLLTGLRKSDALTILWAHTNLTAEPVQIRVWNANKLKHEEIRLAPFSVHRPCPKGGQGRAFTIPLPQFLVGLLKRHREVQHAIWVFPGVKYRAAKCSLCTDLGLPAHSPGVVAHMSHADYGAKLQTPHRLRDTYLTANEELDPPMPEGVARRLVNHADSTVTQGYRRQGEELLAFWQEKQCEFLLARMKGERHLRAVGHASLFDVRELTPKERAAYDDDQRPGVWTAELGADLRMLTQDQTDALIRGELVHVAAPAEREQVRAAIGGWLRPVRVEIAPPDLVRNITRQRGGIDSDPLVRLLAYRAWGDRDRRWPELRGEPKHCGHPPDDFVDEDTIAG